MKDRLGIVVAVIVSDTFGRPWRNAATDVAIGVAGIDPIRSYVGQMDSHGHEMFTTEIAVGTKLGIDATKKLPAEGHRRAWPPLIKMDESTKLKIDDYLNKRK